MSGPYIFRPAVREGVPLLIGAAGGTGSGKSYSLLELATGMTPPGQRFAFIDTEAGRGRAYADLFSYDYAEVTAPFRPERFLEAVKAAEAAGYPVIIVDSFSHEYAGHGGLLDWHDEELDRMAGNDWKKRGAMSVPAWSAPKQAHKRMVDDLTQIRAHLLFGLRAEPKVDMKRDAQTGRTEIVERVGAGGFRGWIPICEKNFPYELTCSFLLMAEEPGVPRPIKLQQQHSPFVPLDRPLSRETGRRLAEWARGGTAPAPAATPPEEPPQRPARAPKPAPEPSYEPTPAPAEPSPAPPASGLDDIDLGLVGDWRNQLMEYMQAAKLRPIDVSSAIGAPFGMDAIEAHCRANGVHWRELVDGAPNRSGR